MFYIDLRIELSPLSVNRRFRSLANPISKTDRRASYPKKEKPESVPRALPCLAPAD